MKKYTVRFYYETYADIEVSASNEDEALSMADEIMCGSGYEEANEQLQCHLERNGQDVTEVCEDHDAQWYITEIENKISISAAARVEDVVLYLETIDQRLVDGVIDALLEQYDSEGNEEEMHVVNIAADVFKRDTENFYEDIEAYAQELA